MSVKYPAVALVASRGCCAAVKGLAGSKILAAAAPNLPLPDCSMPAQCRCKFQKYSDRRDEDNRRFQFASERSAWYSGGQRRRSGGRRTDD